MTDHAQKELLKQRADEAYHREKAGLSDGTKCNAAVRYALYDSMRRRQAEKYAIDMTGHSGYNGLSLGGEKC